VGMPEPVEPQTKVSPLNVPCDQRRN